MESKYQDKYESAILEAGFKFTRLLDNYRLYRKWNGEVIIANVTLKGKLEVLLHNTLNEVKEDEE